MSDDTQIYHGQCYCGSVKLTAEGAPFASGYCHCESCRRFHGTPMMAWSAWPADAVTVKGETRTVTQCDATHRVTCVNCGGKIMGIKPQDGVNVLFPSVLAGSGAPFEPMGHMYYDQRMLDIDDGLPKFADKPEALGGSGRMSDAPARSGVRVDLQGLAAE